MPAVDSSGECNQIVDRNLIVEVQCKEQHRLKPLSNGISGVHVTLRQHLDLFTVYTSSAVNSTEEDDDELFGKKDDDEDDGFSFGLDDEDEEEGESEKPEEILLYFTMSIMSIQPSVTTTLQPTLCPNSVKLLR